MPRPVLPQADRGSVRLDHEGCGPAQDQAAQPAYGLLELHLRRGRLQSDASAEANRGGDLNAVMGYYLWSRDDGTIEIELSFHDGGNAILKVRRE